MRKMLVGVTVSACALSAAALTERQIDDLLARMTLEEKVGQLVQIASVDDIGELAESPDATRIKLSKNVEGEVRNGRVGSLIGAPGIANFNTIQRVAVRESRLGVPLMIGHDMIHGVKTQFPCPLGFSCAWDEDIWYRGGRLIALEAPLKGCNWAFSPMLDLCRDPRWGRIVESPGQDPYLGARMAGALVRGEQSQDVAMKVAATVKHFVGYGAAFSGRDYNSVEMSESTLRNVYLPPFKAGIKAGVLTVVPAFHTMNGVPCSIDKRLLSDILRDELGFAGFTLSDWDALGECLLRGHGVAEDRRELAAMAIKAGMDQDMISGIYQKELIPAVKAGLVSVELIDRSVRRVLWVKNRLGLFEHPYIDEAAVLKQVDLKAHANFAREAGAKCCVLLKNENEVLPLKPGVKVALVGPGAEDEANLSGAWSSFIENKSDMLLTEGLRAAGVDFTYTPGYGWHDEPVDTAALEAAVGKADVVVAIFGEHGQESGEGWSKLRLELSKGQLEALAFLKRLKKPIVALLTNGRPLAIPELAEGADAILEAWSPGTSAGAAIADVLTGKVNPQGRLTTEFPYATGQLPLFYNRLQTGRPTEQIRWSCFRDGPHVALFPFGSGLSYTTFAYTNETVLVREGVVVLTADVKNAGARAGVETVQAYVRQRVGVESRPIRELKGWKKVALAPGETKRVAIEIPVGELSYWAKDRLIQASGKMNAWICHDSVSGTPLAFEL